MSAFIVDDKVINEILSYVKANSRREDISEALSYRFSQTLKSSLTANETLEILGQRLLDGNYKSVNFRYRETEKAHTFTFKPTPFSEIISQVQYFKYLDCLNYQSCEPDDYFTNEYSVFWDICSLISFGTSKITGYEAASWG